ILDEEGFNHLIEKGIKFPWTLRHGRVCVWNSDGYISVSRLIMGAKTKQKVIYLDGDPLNLLKSNLVISSGLAKIKPIYRPWDKLKINHIYKPGKITINSFNYQ